MSIKNKLKKSAAGTLAGISLFICSTAGLAATNYPTYNAISGDTLWIMSNKLYTSSDKIASVNSINSDSIMAGQRLVIPQSNIYKVVSGDTPYLIAKRFGISLQVFLTANNMTSSDVLYPGQQVNLPGILAYKVANKDTLSLLATQFGTTINQLTKINNLTDTNIITDQKIYIPVAETKQYTVQSGDSLYLIAQKYNLSVSDLTNVNWLSSTNLKAGQILIIPGKTSTTTSAATSSSGQSQATLWNIPSGALLYHVQEGDNQWSIAQKYNTTTEAINKTNNIKIDLILPEQALFVPKNSTQPIYGIKCPSVKAKTGYGELLDWEYVNWFFNPGSTAVIEDLQTGIKFKAHRIGGSNHADCEPLSADDTAIMKGIFGGQWNWSTRPVLVRFEGRVLAASMAGMPHSFDTLSNNAFYGMFDLHFLNSRTHNTNTIDPDHQASVRKAAGY
ncbi:Peptidoglycan-binding LysM [Desulfofarcimen acetoxidans DSM 771]|uniref:Peptidoglycan-binding LysM n=1 Tax=Desulfofarcimen acetoxidans (strain ATCC 49208 / DSM 771 / KCTC 5769 / VKM B-1644 / 5575) TaxID=485916 RepID=C8VVY5_DESAS|nr:LysM peptidoglycan-binding domain-containing protein [Desulfofarcimen acetoxidans]ACV64272.1 Peptidoglycan-binding LysM [Desulfofarcimen acetoxidans DSM 771]